MLCLVLQSMVYNSGHQPPLTLVSRLLNPGVQVYHQEDFRSCGAMRQGLLQPAHLLLAVGWYVRPNYIPTLPLCHRHKTCHVWSIVFHPIKLPSLLLPPHDDDDDQILALCLRRRYVIAGDLPQVYPLRQLCLLEDANPQISLLQCG